jgi:hypothetical protein
VGDPVTGSAFLGGPADGKPVSRMDNIVHVDLMTALHDSLCITWGTVGRGGGERSGRSIATLKEDLMADESTRTATEFVVLYNYDDAVIEGEDDMSLRWVVLPVRVFGTNGAKYALDAALAEGGEIANLMTLRDGMMFRLVPKRFWADEPFMVRIATQTVLTVT